MQMWRIAVVLYEWFGFILVAIAIMRYRNRFFARDRKYHDFLERFGFYSASTLDALKGSNIWIHAVSIGEILAAVPLVEELGRQFPDRKIVISSVTITGRALAQDHLPANTVKILFPFDSRFAVRRALRAIHPEIFITMETEIWPTVLQALKRQNIPAVLFNGRISPGSFRVYRRFRKIVAPLLDSFSLMAMRSKPDAERIIAIGAGQERVRIIKSIKFDQARALNLKEARIVFPPGRMIVFGSIHADEELPVVQLCKKLFQHRQEVRIAIVPRALDRTRIYTLLSESALPFIRKSRWNREDFRIMVVDEYGVLTEFYRSCEFAFVGGSLARAGGQNPIEPLAFGKPVLYGPYHWDFEEEWEIIKKAGAGLEVADFQELEEKIEFLLTRPDIAAEMGKHGYDVIEENCGTTPELVSMVRSIIDERQIPSG